jgi:hypothetical protein
MEKLIFKSDHPMGACKYVVNGDILGEWQFYRDDKQWVNGEEVPAKIFTRSGWACLEHNDFDAVKTFADSPLYYLWDAEEIVGFFRQFKRTYGGDFPGEFVESPILEKVEGVEKCPECCGNGYKFDEKFSKILPPHTK